jgi:hypothetical protein
VKPSIVFNFNDFTERFILWEFSVDALKIDFVVFKNLKESFHSNFVPPIILLQNEKDASENVSNVSTTTDIAWKCAV